MNTQEKRKFSRINIDAPVIISQDKRTWSTRLIDISLKGMLTERPIDWPNDDNESQVTIQLPGHEIHMEVSTAHIEEQAIGFRCNNIDIDSIANLKRMVELNLADESMLDREITAMMTAT